MGYALVNAQLADKRAAQREINIVPVFTDGYNGSELLYDARKHNANFLNMFLKS